MTRSKRAWSFSRHPSLAGNIPYLTSYISMKSSLICHLCHVAEEEVGTVEMANKEEKKSGERGTFRRRSEEEGR